MRRKTSSHRRRYNTRNTKVLTFSRRKEQWAGEMGGVPGKEETRTKRMWAKAAQVR